MTLKVFNTLTRQKEEFQPLYQPAAGEKQKVGMYVCGITPYDESHLGHGRVYIVFDVIRRYLKFCGYDVTHIQNFTDIDDKIIQRAVDTGASQEELAARSKEIADKNIASYFEMMDKLGVQRADNYPRVTEHMPEIMRTVKDLQDMGAAYETERGDVYFAVEKFPPYGKLSRRDRKALEEGVTRVAAEAGKKSPLDFALWKSAKPGEPSWHSPWGQGRPGWHIECSVMSTKYLGPSFDIHGGGMDLIFPHHENEKAQSESWTGKPFVKYWLHNGFVTVNQEKMSKSLGNFFTLRDVLAKYSPALVRYYILATHYRSPIQFGDQLMEEAREGLNRLVILRDTLREKIRDIDKQTGHAVLPITPEGVAPVVALDIVPYKSAFGDAMDDDFNTASALSVLFEFGHEVHRLIAQEAAGPWLHEALRFIEECDGVLGILALADSQAAPLDDEVQKRIDDRQAARKAKNFKEADRIRDDLAARGIILEDSASGVRWRRKI